MAYKMSNYCVATKWRWRLKFYCGNFLIVPIKMIQCWVGGSELHGLFPWIIDRLRNLHWRTKSSFFTTSFSFFSSFAANWLVKFTVQLLFVGNLYRSFSSIYCSCLSLLGLGILMSLIPFLLHVLQRRVEFKNWHRGETLIPEMDAYTFARILITR